MPLFTLSTRFPSSFPWLWKPSNESSQRRLSFANLEMNVGNAMSMIVSITMALLLVHQIQGQNATDPLGFLARGGKIAFLFVVRGHMPLEDVWREFFGFQADPQYYSIHVHPHHGFKYSPTSFFYGKEVPHRQNVRWGGMSQVRAIKSVVREALKDPANEWMVLMSETCIPLHPFPVWRTAFAKQNKSMINACAMHPSEMETDTRWRPSLDTVGMTKDKWRKSATWFALNRRHSWVFVNETEMEKGWESVPCCDEHYLPSTLAFHGMDNETTCSDGFCHVLWDSLLASHPHMYGADEIGKPLFDKFNRAVGKGEGFSQLCSGNPDHCHFTARKFSPNAKFPILENIHLILNDNNTGVVYNNDQWSHFNEKLRVDSGNVTKYYLMEPGYMREIPDLFTLKEMHLNISRAKPLTDDDKTAHPFGAKYPSRKDYQLLKAPKRMYIYLVLNGKRHGIPNMQTLSKLGMGLHNVTITSESDIEQIPLGDPISA